jgi:hypothetical protein
MEELRTFTGNGDLFNNCIDIFLHGRIRYKILQYMDTMLCQNCRKKNLPRAYMCIDFYRLLGNSMYFRIMNLCSILVANKQRIEPKIAQFPLDSSHINWLYIISKNRYTRKW